MPIPTLPSTSTLSARGLFDGLELIRGSLVRMSRRCGKSGCRCAEGKPHVSLYLAVGGKGGRRMIFVPQPWAPVVRGWIRNYQQIDRLSRGVSEACLRRLLDAKKNALNPPTKTEGKTMTNPAISRAAFRSPVGTIHLAATPKGLAALYFDPQLDDMTGRLTARFGKLPAELSAKSAELPPLLRRAVDALGLYFAGETGALHNLPLDVAGTEFEQSVWNTLRRIETGKTTTYGEIARRLGNPKASRAVGRATGRNPVSLVIPCHRALGANHKLTGYAGGLERKEYLLGHEGVVGTLDLAAA